MAVSINMGSFSWVSILGSPDLWKLPNTMYYVMYTLHHILYHIKIPDFWKLPYKELRGWFWDVRDASRSRTQSWGCRSPLRSSFPGARPNIPKWYVEHTKTYACVCVYIYNVDRLLKFILFVYRNRSVHTYTHTSIYIYPYT